jgi:hypothetical protein
LHGTRINADHADHADHSTVDETRMDADLSNESRYQLTVVTGGPMTNKEEGPRLAPPIQGNPRPVLLGDL